MGDLNLNWDIINDHLTRLAGGDQAILNQWEGVVGDSHGAELVQAGALDNGGMGVFNFGLPDAGSFTSDGPATLPDGSEISDTFGSFENAIGEVEISEEELPSMIEHMYSISTQASTQGAQEMFAESSLESSIEGLDENIEALEAEIEALEADVEALTVQIEGLEAAVAEGEIAVEGAAAEVTAAAEEVTAAAAAEAAADASEAADWWTIIGGIISGVAKNLGNGKVKKQDRSLQVDSQSNHN